MKVFPYIYFFKSFKNPESLFNLLSKLKQAEEKSLLFMQDIANSPTGEDPKMEQWKEIINIVKQKQITVVLDSAFQGYSSGDLESDNEIVRLFLKEDIPFHRIKYYKRGNEIVWDRQKKINKL